MADNVLFDVDAAQILAKLHLAGIQSISIPNDEFIINTGIKNDNPNAKPDNPGKVTFDLKNSTNEYQVGYTMFIEYKKSYGLDDQINKLEQLMANLTDGKIDQKSTDPKVKKKIEEIEEKKKVLQQILGKDIKLDTAADVSQAKDKAKEVIKDNETDYKDAVKKANEYASKQLKTYLDNFAGADNVTSFKDAAMITISDKAKDSNDKSLVSMFQIQEAPKAEVEKMVEQFKLAYQKDPNKPNCKQHVCFVVNYTLNVDK